MSPPPGIFCLHLLHGRGEWDRSTISGNKSQISKWLRTSNLAYWCIHATRLINVLGCVTLIFCLFICYIYNSYSKVAFLWHCFKLSRVKKRHKHCNFQIGKQSSMAWQQHKWENTVLKSLSEAFSPHKQNASTYTWTLVCILRIWSPIARMRGIIS